MKLQQSKVPGSQAQRGDAQGIPSLTAASRRLTGQGPHATSGVVPGVLVQEHCSQDPGPVLTG